MGKIELDHTGSGGGVTLSSDGTDLLLDGTAIGGGGGGGADLYAAETTGSTDPTASGTLSVAIGSSAAASGTDAVSIGTSSKAGSYSVGIGTSSGNIGPNNVIIGRNATTYTQSSVVIGHNADANDYGSSQAAIGYESKAMGTGATALVNSYASGSYSFAAAIANNSSSYGATGANSIAIGDRSKATGSRGVAIGGYNAIASGTSSMATGYQAEASTTYAHAHGYQAEASGQRSWASTRSVASGNDSWAAAINDTTATYGSQHAYSVALGYQAVTTADYQIALGSSTAQVKVSGAYTLPTSDGTNGQVLTTDGSGAVTFANAGGGASLQYFAEDADAPPTAPSATGTYAVAIGDNSTASGIRATAIGGATCSGNSESIAIGSGAVSSANVSTAVGPNSDATSAGSLAIGYSAQAVTGSYATAVSRAYASGADSFAAAIASNSSSYGATGVNSMAMGYLCKSTGPNGVSLGQNNIVSGGNATAIGYFNTASGYYTTALGYDNTTSGAFGHAIGYQAVSSVKGKGAYASGAFSADGDAQSGLFTLRSDTTDATPEALTTDNSTPGTVDQIILSDNSAYAFHGTIVARQQASGGTASAAWKVEGLIRREGSAGTTVLVNSATTVLDNTPSWGMALSADTTNGGLAITVTGAASTNIRWVATIHTSEVTYA